MPAADAKSSVLELVDSRADDLVDLSHRLHANPEISWEEEQSSRWCADVLSDAGFDVTMGVADLPTAFEASAGSGELAANRAKFGELFVRSEQRNPAGLRRSVALEQLCIPELFHDGQLRFLARRS